MADLPSGAVTFLFTDIEGSTRLVRQLRGRYAEVLADHQRLLREAFARHGGHEIDTQGDAFFYVFASAHDAVLAAVDGQRAVLGYEWPDGAPVKVRMGLHTGRASPVDGRFTGLAVHRAARICAAGHGGQVIVSQATQSLLEDEEDELAVALEDLGEQRLKDMERPVRLYQVAAAGLPTEFPPIRGETDPRDVSERARAPLYRRWPAVGALSVGLAVVAGATVLFLTRDAGGGLSEVPPNHVGAIDAETNEIVGAIALDAAPGPIAAGDDTVWVLEPSSRTLARIDPRARELADSGGIGGTPDNLAAAGTGAWVSDGCFMGGAVTLVRFDTRQAGAGDAWADIRLDDLGLPPRATALSSYGCGLYATTDSVWLAVNNPPAAVRVDIDPASDELRVGQVVPLPSGPTAIAGGAGSVWAADNDGNVVRRIHPGTGEVLAEIKVGKDPAAVAVGAGVVWVGNRGESAVSRIDPLTNTVSTEIPVGDSPVAVAVGEGSVWVANSGDDSVSRIDPRTNRVTATISLGHPPQAIAVAAGAAWVTVGS